MAYFNNADDTTYPNSFTFDEFDEYPILGQTSAASDAAAITPTFAHGWGMGGEPGPMISSSRSLRPEASFGEYEHGFIDDVRFTQVFRVGDFCHFIHAPCPGPRAAVPCDLLADNWPIHSVIPFRRHEPG